MSDITNEQGGNERPHVVLPTQATGLEEHLRQAGQPEGYQASQFVYVFERPESRAADVVRTLLAASSFTVSASLGKEHSTLVSLLELSQSDEDGDHEWSVIAFSALGLDDAEIAFVWGNAARLTDDSLDALGASVRLVSPLDMPA